MKTQRRKQNVNAGGVQFVEDLRQAKTLRGRHLSQHEAACGAERLFECLWCALTSRALFAHAGAQSFFASKHAGSRHASATGHFREAQDARKETGESDDWVKARVPGFRRNGKSWQTHGQKISYVKRVSITRETCKVRVSCVHRNQAWIVGERAGSGCTTSRKT